MKPSGGGGKAIETAERLLALLTVKGLRIAFAESCTGGLLSALISEIPGASTAFWGGVVCYSLDAKTRLLDVSQETLERFGAVSAQTVREMALGLYSRSAADIVVAVSGFAGPETQPGEASPGRVCFAWSMAGSEPLTLERHFSGNRNDIRWHAVLLALQGAMDLLEEGKCFDPSSY